jgi:hypothetical protein
VECPNSAPNWFVSSVNSAVESVGTYTRGPVTVLLLLSTPSTMKLLFIGRWPPTDGPVPCPTPPLLATPELSRDRFSAPKSPLAFSMIGRLAIWWDSNVD